MSWHYGALLALFFPTYKFWRFGDAIRHKHNMDSHHWGNSNCSLCLHFGRVKGCVRNHNHAHPHRDKTWYMCDVAQCVGRVLILLMMMAKCACLLYIFQLILLAGDVETNPGPPCMLLICCC